MTAIVREAFARAGLLGNPSDAFGGRALATPVRNFGARARVEPAARFAIALGKASAKFESWAALESSFTDHRRDGGLRLLAAAVHRFASLAPGLDPPPLRLCAETTVPFQVGLAGSSALVIAALRALAAHFEQALDVDDLARLALAAEVEDLGITAGWMDRLVQARDELLVMDLRDVAAPACEPLDPALLPPLFLAWDPEPGLDSGATHHDMRSRWEAGDAEVVDAMHRFAALADEGVAHLRRGDSVAFADAMNANFALRRSLYTLRPRDVTLVEIGQREGAAAKFCGSGGAAIGVLRDPADFPKLEAAYRAAGFAAIRPDVGATPGRP